MYVCMYRTQIQPSDHDIVAISGQWLDIAGYQDSGHGFWLANCEFGNGKLRNYQLGVGGGIVLMECKLFSAKVEMYANP